MASIYEYIGQTKNRKSSIYDYVKMDNSKMLSELRLPTPSLEPLSTDVRRETLPEGVDTEQAIKLPPKQPYSPTYLTEQALGGVDKLFGKPETFEGLRTPSTIPRQIARAGIGAAAFLPATVERYLQSDKDAITFAGEEVTGLLDMIGRFPEQAALLAGAEEPLNPLDKFLRDLSPETPEEIKAGLIEAPEEPLFTPMIAGGGIRGGRGLVRKVAPGPKPIAEQVAGQKFPKFRQPKAPIEPSGRTVKLPSLEEPIIQKPPEPIVTKEAPVSPKADKISVKSEVPSAKQPYEMTESESIQFWRDRNWTKQPDGTYTRLSESTGQEVKVSPKEVASLDRTTSAAHKFVVEDALAEGKPVPPEVLKDYPDLAKKLPSVEQSFVQKKQQAKVGEAIPPVEPPKSPVETAKPKTPDGRDFVLNNENIAKIRKSYAGFDELPPPQKKGVLKSSEEAIKNRYDENAHAIAQEVNKKSRPLSDSEQAGMFLRMNEVEPIYQESINTWKKLRDEGKTEAARLEYARANKFRSEMDDITTALRYSGGTGAGRALAIRRNLKQETISEILFEAEELKGKRLSEPEAQKIETAFSEEKRLEKQLADMTAKYEAERAKSNEVIAKRVINQQLRGKRTTAKREEIKQNLSNIEKQLQGLGFRVNDITGASVEALYLIGRYAGELAKLGELQFEGIVRQIKSKFPEFTDKDVIQGIVTKDPARQMKARAEATKRVAQLKQQARLILDIEKAEQGIFEPRKDRPTAPEPIRSLQDKLKELRKQAYKSGLDSARLERALNLINQLDDQLKNQYRMVKDKQTIPAPELAEAKAKIAELRKQMRVEDALADLNEQFRTGDFKIKEKPQPKHIPEELERLQVQLKRQRRQRRDIVEELAPKTLKSYGLEAINTARTLKATADMSATLRQGLFPSIHLLRKGKFVDLAKTTGNAVKSFFSEYTADRIDNMIREMDNHYIRERAGLYLAERGTPKALRREEHFMSKVIDRIPVLRQITRASERHMTTTLNLLRVSMFDSFLEKFPNATTVELRAWADFVNAASGRGEIGGKINGLNNIFFAPRFAASRFQTPFKAVKYWRHPRVRNEIVKDISASVGLGLLALEIAHLSGAEIGIDPVEADFGKIRVGDQRFDIWAGFQQPARLIARIGLKGLSRAEFIEDKEKQFDPVGAVGRFLGYKLSPAITIPNELLTGVTAVGQPTTVDETTIRSLIPIVYQEFYDEGINKETLLGAGVGFFGVGANLYEDPKSRVRRDIMKLLKSGETDKAKERAANWNKLNPDDRIVEFNVVVEGDTTKVRVAPKTPKRQR